VPAFAQTCHDWDADSALAGWGCATETDCLDRSWARRPGAAEAWTRDIWGYNVFKSTTSGGPYTKVNSTPVLAGAPQHWTLAGLTNGQSYYFVITAVDFTANESAASAEVVAVPGP
jgi:hypothetical protein